MVRKERLELSRREALEPKSSVSTNSTTFAGMGTLGPATGRNGVDDGTRTHDRRDHNPLLYQLSYAHHNLLKRTRNAFEWRARQDSNLRPSA
jgi:hypothetical protein